MGLINNISLETNFVQAKGNIVSDMNGEKVMLNIMNGKYYNLGVVGGDIWSLIETPITLHEIVENLVSRYEVEMNECKVQVSAFLNQLLNEKLIQTADNR